MVFNEKHTKLPIKKTPNLVMVMFVVHILDLFTQIQFSRATVPQMEQIIPQFHQTNGKFYLLHASA